MSRWTISRYDCRVKLIGRINGKFTWRIDAPDTEILIAVRYGALNIHKKELIERIDPELYPAIYHWVNGQGMLVEVDGKTCYLEEQINWNKDKSQLVHEGFYCYEDIFITYYYKSIILMAAEEFKEYIARIM